MSCWAHVCCCCVASWLSRTFRTATTPPPSALLPPAPVGSSRRTVNVYDTLEIVYQVRERRRCQRTVIKCHLKHKWSWWSKQGAARGVLWGGDLAENGLISYWGQLVPFVLMIEYLIQYAARIFPRLPPPQPMPTPLPSCLYFYERSHCVSGKLFSSN